MGRQILVLASLLLAGCVTAPVPAAELEPSAAPGTGIDKSVLSKAVHGALPKVGEYVQVSTDGIRLYTEVYLPDGEGPWPTVLIMSPYYNHGVNAMVDVEQRFRERYVPRGYAVVTVDVRGTGESEGCMDMMGAKEQQDGYDMVEWVAAQPWSDGKVGMYGVSYVGTTPSAAAILAPPHLVTIVPIAGVTNQWRNMYQNGVPYNGRWYPLTYEASEGLPPPGDLRRGPAWAANAAAGACGQEEMVEHMSPGVYERGVYDDYWAERNFTTRARNVTASVFYVQGFTDRAVNPMEAIHWFNDIDAPKKAWLGQWPHRLPPRDDWDDTLLAWFDHWLKGIDTGIMRTPTVEVLTNLDTIRVDDEWPPEDAARLRLNLSDGALTAGPADEGKGTYASGPEQVGVSLGPLRVASPLGRNLTFVGDPLAEDLHLAGPAVLHLKASSDRPHAYLLASLYDVDGDTWTELAEGWMNAHLREGFDQSAPLTPGETYAFSFKFEPREYVVEKGHKLALRIHGWDARVSPYGAPRTTNTIEYGPEGSWLELPYVADPVVHDRPSTV